MAAERGSVLMGDGGCGPGDPRASQGLPGAFLLSDLGPHGPSDSRGLLPSRHGCLQSDGHLQKGDPGPVSWSPARQLLREQTSLSLVRASRLPPAPPPPPGLALPPHGRASGQPPSRRLDHLSSLVQHPALTRPPLPPPPCSPVESFKLQTQPPLACLKLFMAPWCPGIKPKLLTRPKPTTWFPTLASLFSVQCSPSAPAPRVP